MREVKFKSFYYEFQIEVNFYLIVMVCVMLYGVGIIKDEIDCLECLIVGLLYVNKVDELERCRNILK